jgi:hypothetical protein
MRHDRGEPGGFHVDDGLALFGFVAMLVCMAVAVLAFASAVGMVRHSLDGIFDTLDHRPH